MNFSSQKGQLAQGPLLSRMDTGTLHKILEEVISVEELGSRCTKPLFLQKKKTQKILTYTQQLLDPRWKAKRKSILTRDKFNCLNCKANLKLHVHHIRYTGYAWEAPDKDLITLCAACHKKVHTGILEIVEDDYFLDGKIIYPIENTNPHEFDLYTFGATDKDIPYLAINRYGTKDNPGNYFISDIRAWGYND